MKILIAPDSFKGSLSAEQIANSMEKGIRRVKQDAEVFKIPMADGGEGTIDAILAAKKGEKVYLEVNDPLRRPVRAHYAIIAEENTILIEIATASGLPLLAENERNPLKTSTFGTGELIKNALERIADLTNPKIVVCIGGSATNDGGAGMLQALGARFLDKNNKEINVCGGNLKEIKEIDLTHFANFAEIEIIIASDVENPLLGNKGASAVFAPQKGATPAMVEILEENLTHFADLVEVTFPNLTNLRNQQGTGAAGGLGYGLTAFLHAQMQKGVEIVLNITQLEETIKQFSLTNKDLVITGEGAMDFQTAFGKVPLGVAHIAKKYNIPVIGVAGTLGKGYQTLYQHGFDSLFSIIDKPMSLQEAINQTEYLIENTMERIMRLYLLS
jgi:glycerate kinase